ncbi:DUF1476 domain-containing protein [Novosphingobium profundi]|uniref:DUF1476 domain-containing protein n=1 Tax=Novosphingobium profundi TaxID=1774954 RepID=UPI001BDB143A|nr:DUF1476 domain-containing protein [Novosphingobium profundi]MBT0669817.1 DUF1476 domain-containing protein [Novosphingobium profundi]
MKSFSNRVPTSPAAEGERSQLEQEAEIQFRIQARRNRLVGEWAAARMGLSDAETEAYAKSVVQADFEEAGDEDVIRKLLGDITAAGVDTTEGEVRAALDAKQVEARRAFLGAA